jgi:hypothetical protein
MAWNKSTHVILLMTKFYNREIGIRDLKDLNPERFKKSNCKRELLRLELMGFIRFTNAPKTRWVITNAGYSFLYQFASKYSKRMPEPTNNGV